ncbi:ABI gene family member 3 [Eublepharis macularius]|uniref:ABI gene family member 3 n=1 Tax=Eublepharis macularius TaxID=481883 RepID=A0AA97K5P1_EUBMA|nr:ABI gene family member 3 [Eublepharis macularius]
MSEFQQMTESSILCAREVLRDNYKNLLQVADYCESNYEGAQDKRKALEETMAFTTQSLASVAYQISTLANDILKILDLQATEVRQVEASICSVAQVVEMHKEKVARRQIGMLAVCKRFPHYQKIIYPDHLEPLGTYYRKPLNFSSLDDIGHGMKDQSTQLARTGTLGRRGTKTSAGQSPGSLRRSHRTLEPIQTPIVPDTKQPSASLGSSPSSSTGAMDSISLRVPTEPPPPPPSLLSLFPPPMEADDIPLPPPPQADILPPPPPPLAIDELPPLDLPAPEPDFPASLPPPPLDVTDLEPLGPPVLPPPPPPEKLPWAPDTYLEKVVTLYPYAQQKENELSFEEGAILYMTRRYSDGWCEGVSSEAEGLFPGNYVEPLQ